MKFPSRPRAGFLALAFSITLTLFSLPATAQTYRVLYRFSGPPGDGAFPQARLTLDDNGDAYGTTVQGGKNNDGTVFKLSKRDQFVYSFSLPNGGAPIGGVVLGNDHQLYGTTAFGADGGTVFEIDKSGNAIILYQFNPGINSPDGNQPQATILINSAGNIYGTTVLGGISITHEYGGFGTVFELTPSGNEATLHAFSGPDGDYPRSGLLADAQGNMYGTTSGDGETDFGTVYEMGSDGTFTSLYTFKGGTDGAEPMAGLISDAIGNLYGTTKTGGEFGQGTVFQLDPNHNETLLYSFTGAHDGSQPHCDLVRDTEGNIYGTTIAGGKLGLGTIFKLDVTGHETVLHSFAGGVDGERPYAGLVQDQEGNLYGTTTDGGNGFGTIFRVTP